MGHGFESRYVYIKRSKWKGNPSVKYTGISIITKSMLTENVKVYNGKSWRTLKLKSEHLGHRLGEFHISKKLKRHVKK